MASEGCRNTTDTKVASLFPVISEKASEPNSCSRRFHFQEQEATINIIITTVCKTFSAAQSQRQMDAPYDSQVRTNNLKTTQQNAAFCGPARQMGAGAGGLRAFALRLGRVCKFILPVAK